MEIDDGRTRSGRAIYPVRSNPDDSPLPVVDPETHRKFSEFSPDAKSATRRLVMDYLSCLIDASLVAEKKVNGDQVSEANVHTASQIIGTKDEENGLKKLAGIIGGIFLGTGISSLISILQAGKFDRTGIILMAVCGILGAFLVATDLPGGILPERRKRRASAQNQPARVRRRTVPKTPNSQE